jgi:hypothetical protein
MADTIYERSNPNASVVRQLEDVKLFEAIQGMSQRTHTDNVRETQSCPNESQCRREVRSSRDVYVPSTPPAGKSISMHNVTVFMGTYSDEFSKIVERTETYMPQSAVKYRQCMDAATAYPCLGGDYDYRTECREQRWQEKASCEQRFAGQPREAQTRTIREEVQTQQLPAVAFGEIIYDFTLNGTRCNLRVNGDQGIIAGGVNLSCSDSNAGITPQSVVPYILDYYNYRPVAK